MNSFVKSKKSKIKIKDMPASMRPREKLFAQGARNLSEAELIAILLGTGSAKVNAIKLGEKLLQQFPLTKITEERIHDMAKYPGVGLAKTARIAAALELGERLFSPATLTKIIIHTASDVISQVRDIADKKQEYLMALYLNARHELVLKEVVGMGSLTSLQITPKEIFSHALKKPCASLIVVHNHPSGDPEPSDDDIRFTRHIHEAGEVMGIPLLDHVIISRGGYYSFRETNNTT